MAEQELSVLVKVQSEGTEKLTQVTDGMGKLEKTSALVATSTKRGTEASSLYNTSLVKTIPQMQVLTPLMNSLGLGSLMTAGAVGLLSLGLLKVGQSALATQTGVQGLGAAMGQYTAGPWKNFYQTLSETKKLADSFGQSTNQTATALKSLVAATRDEGTALELLSKANKISVASGQSLVSVSDQLAKAWSEGAIISGKAVPPGPRAANALADMLMKTQPNAGGRVMGDISRSFSRFFDPNSSDFLKGLIPKEGSFSILPPFYKAPGSGSNPTQVLPNRPTTFNLNIDGKPFFQFIWDEMNGVVRGRGGF